MNVPLVHQPGKLDHQQPPVQRISALLPVSEIGNLPPADQSVHVCDNTIRVPDLQSVSARSRSRSAGDRRTVHQPLLDPIQEEPPDTMLEQTAEHEESSPDITAYIHHQDWKETAASLLPQ